MTPEKLVQIAQRKSPFHWKGRQTVIRRLARTQGLPEKTMHDALRLGVKLLRKDSSLRQHRSFHPNRDTPADVRAEYLKEPYEYGINNKDCMLAWAKEASAATLLKMTRQSDVAAVELFRRDHADASSRIRNALQTGDSAALAWLKRNLAGHPWTDKQFSVMVTLATARTAYKLWHDEHSLLSQFFQEADRRSFSDVDGAWLSNCLGLMDLRQLLEPCPSTMLRKAMLVEAYNVVCKGTPEQQERYVSYLEPAIEHWYAMEPSRQDCLDLARGLDHVFNEGRDKWPNHGAQDWQERHAIVLPFIAMLGRNRQEAESALDMYRTLDPSLLAFSTLAASLEPSEHNHIDFSELLCP